MDFWVQWKILTWLASIYLLNFGILGQIQLRSWNITSCCWDIINNKDASPEENNFSSRICTKSRAGGQAYGKSTAILFPNFLFSTSESSANLWNLSGFSCFLGILKSPFYFCSDLPHTIIAWGCSKQSSRKKSPCYKKFWLSKNYIA